MGFFKVDIRNMQRHEFQKVCSENKCKTTEDVLDIIFGHCHNDYFSEYVLKDTYADEPKEKFYHRLNLIWVVALFLIIAPFRFLLFGEARFKEDSKMGNILRFFIGTLR